MSRTQNSKSDVISSGENAKIIVEIEALTTMQNMTAGIFIRDRFGQDIFGTNTFFQKMDFNIRERGKYKILYDVKMDLGMGKYSITAATQKSQLMGLVVCIG